MITMTTMTPVAMPACRATCRVQCGRARMSASTNARIGYRIEQVGREASKGDRRCGDDDARCNKWIVAGSHGVQHDPSHAGPRKDTLDEHRAREQYWKRQPEQADCGDQRVAKYMNHHHTSLAHSLRSRGPHVIVWKHA